MTTKIKLFLSISIHSYSYRKNFYVNYNYIQIKENVFLFYREALAQVSSFIFELMQNS
jgi:hypothetical protein